MTSPTDKIKGGMIRLNGGPMVAVDSPEGEAILAQARKLMQENPEVVPTVSINDGPAHPMGSPELEAEIQKIMESPLFYLRNKERGYLGNSPLWWALGGAGYTDNLDKSEKFEKDDAEKMVRENPDKWEAYPCSLIDQHAYRTFDSQNFRDVKAAMAAKKRCKKCNDTLGHDDDGPNICRFCDSGYTSEGPEGTAAAGA